MKPVTQLRLAAALLPLVGAGSLAICPTDAPGPRRNAYAQVNLVSNMPELKPQILDPLLKDGWGIAIRPPGQGGHFWINNTQTGTTTTYVGDVPGVPLYQDELKVVAVPTSILYHPFPETVSQPTGIVYTGWSATDFAVVGEGITGPSKFVFCALDGTISGWTTGQTRTINMVDQSGEGAMYTGLATTELPSGNRLYAADFGLCRVCVFDHQFRPVTVAGDFRDPSVPDLFSAWNIQLLEGKLYVTWARVGDDPGEEEHYPGYGYLSVFDTEGRLLQSLEHRMELNAPWGVVMAPKNFGALGGTLLVANFGDGTIIAYDPRTGRYIDFLRGRDGAPMVIDGIWGMLFGNGVRLGRTNHLYFTAGPNGEEDGLFGKLVPLTP